ncbi:MAG: nucleotidyltransferase domain-containing protein [Acidobacteria bacterium]|nr:nucleotidyltransferase domain-containing protein [Acidobacteriota bacterium]
MRLNEREQMESHLQELVKRLHSAAGDNLHSVVLYGSAASSNFHENFSDVNILCLLRELSACSLLTLSDTVEWWKKQKQALPLFLTINELTQAADTFPIELLDMRTHHRVLYGADLIANLEVPLRLHRTQVEHELRTKLILLRQNFVTRSSEATGVCKLMLDSISSFMTLFRHSLIAMGEEPEPGQRPLLQQLQRKLNLDTRPFRELLNIREGSVKPDALDAATMFSVYLKTIEQVISAVDRL